MHRSISAYSMRCLAGALMLLLLAAACSDSSAPPVRRAPVTPVDLATAGEIHVRVEYRGPVPAPRELNMRSAPFCAEAHPGPVYEQTVKVSDGHLADAVVYIASGLGGRAFEIPAEPVVIDQKGCIYIPRIAALMVGQPLEFRNSDREAHNVRGRPEVARAWNFMMSRPSSTRTLHFDKPEVGIAVGCDIHPWMRAYVSIFDNPYFAVTPASGSVTLAPLPPGEYVVAVWHESLGSREQTVQLDPSGEVRITLSFEGVG